MGEQDEELEGPLTDGCTAHEVGYVECFCSWKDECNKVKYDPESIWKLDRTAKNIPAANHGPLNQDIAGVTDILFTFYMTSITVMNFAALHL